MSFKTVRDVLQLSRDIHSNASNLFEQLRDQTQRERVDMMLKLLSRHESQLVEALERVEEKTSQRVLDEWHQTEVSSVAQVLEGCKHCHPDITIEELVEMALKVDDALINLYSHMANDASTSESRALFNNLISLEETEKVKTARAALSSYDW